MGAQKLKLKTGFRSYVEPEDTKVTAIYSIIKLTGQAPNNPVNEYLFLYKAGEVPEDGKYSVSASQFIGLAVPEHFNNTNQVHVYAGGTDTGFTWQDLPKAEPVPEPSSLTPVDSEDYWKTVKDALVSAEEADSHGGYFVSRLKVIKDQVPGILSDRNLTDNRLKAFIDGFYDCSLYTTSMDPSKYPFGYDEIAISGKFITITLQVMVTATTQDDSETVRKFATTAFVEKITDAVGTEIPELPKNMFLTIKSDTTPGSHERVEDGMYLRIINPTDIQATNPTVFGFEELQWGLDTQSISDFCLAPAVTSLGTALTTIADAVYAMAPEDIGNTSGYYKSRAYRVITLDAKTAGNNHKLVKSAVSAFVTKYEAQRKAVMGTGYDYWEPGDLS